MADQKSIKKAFNRCKMVLKTFPFLGQKNEKVTVRSGKGLACEVDCGSFECNVDMLLQVGGGATAPTPGKYGLVLWEVVFQSWCECGLPSWMFL